MIQLVVDGLAGLSERGIRPRTAGDPDALKPAQVVESFGEGDSPLGSRALSHGSASLLQDTFEHLGDDFLLSTGQLIEALGELCELGRWAGLARGVSRAVAV